MVNPQQIVNRVHISWDVRLQSGLLFTKKAPSDGIGIPIINRRRSSDRLRFIMGIPSPVQRRLFLVNRGQGASVKVTRCWLVAVRTPLEWRHNEGDGVSNHQPHDCLLKRLFRCRSKKTSKLCVTGFCVGNSPVTAEFPAQMASNAEYVSISWRHHALARSTPVSRAIQSSQQT